MDDRLKDPMAGAEYERSRDFFMAQAREGQRRGWSAATIFGFVRQARFCARRARWHLAK